MRNYGLAMWQPLVRAKSVNCMSTDDVSESRGMIVRFRKLSLVFTIRRTREFLNVCFWTYDIAHTDIAHTDIAHTDSGIVILMTCPKYIRKPSPIFARN